MTANAHLYLQGRGELHRFHTTSKELLLQANILKEAPRDSSDELISFIQECIQSYLPPIVREYLDKLADEAVMPLQQRLDLLNQLQSPDTFPMWTQETTNEIAKIRRTLLCLQAVVDDELREQLLAEAEQLEHQDPSQIDEASIPSDNIPF